MNFFATEVEERGRSIDEANHDTSGKPLDIRIYKSIIYANPVERIMNRCNLRCIVTMTDTRFKGPLPDKRELKIVSNKMALKAKEERRTLQISRCLQSVN